MKNRALFVQKKMKTKIYLRRHTCLFSNPTDSTVLPDEAAVSIDSITPGLFKGPLCSFGEGIQSPNCGAKHHGRLATDPWSLASALVFCPPPRFPISPCAAWRCLKSLESSQMENNDRRLRGELSAHTKRGKWSSKSREGEQILRDECVIAGWRREQGERSLR